MSPEQLRMFQSNLAAPAKQRAAMGPKPPRTRKEKEALPENQVKAQVLDYLRVRGWIMTRRHVGKHVPVGMLLGLLHKGVPITKEVLFRNIVDLGGVGGADWHGERVISRLHHQSIDVEMKAPGKRPSPEQLQWILERNMLGMPACWVDSLDMIVRWHKDQGFGF